MMSYLACETTVVLLAAGHGKRMLPLTANTPKPLLKVKDKCLIEHHLIKLKDEGFRNIVINIAYQGEKIRQFIGDGDRYGLEIQYSDETASGALETAGGLLHALPLIKSDPFLVINADIWTDYPFSQMLKKLEKMGKLLMVNNPTHNVDGDFCIDRASGLLQKNSRHNAHTFSGIGLYHKQVLRGLAPGRHPLAPIFSGLIAAGQLEGELYTGEWLDIGTPQRLTQLREAILKKPLNSQ